MTKREIVGITLWWAEGTKSRRDIRWKNAVTYPIEITNTNPAIIRVFLDFLRQDIGISDDKFKLQLQVHEGDDQHKLEAYWSKITGINHQNFNKTIIRPAGRKPGKSQGTCKIRFADRETYKLLEHMLHKALEGVYHSPEQILTVYDSSKNNKNLVV